MPISSKCLAGPIPDNINNCGELNTPPQSMTSRLASARTVAPEVYNSTPVARVPRSVTLVARASVCSVRLGRPAAPASDTRSTPMPSGRSKLSTGCRRSQPVRPHSDHL